MRQNWTDLERRIHAGDAVSHAEMQAVFDTLAGPRTLEDIQAAKAVIERLTHISPHASPSFRETTCPLGKARNVERRTEWARKFIEALRFLDGYPDPENASPPTETVHENFIATPDQVVAGRPVEVLPEMEAEERESTQEYIDGLARKLRTLDAEDPERWRIEQVLADARRCGYAVSTV